MTKARMLGWRGAERFARPPASGLAGKSYSPNALLLARWLGNVGATTVSRAARSLELCPGDVRDRASALRSAGLIGSSRRKAQCDHCGTVLDEVELSLTEGGREFVSIIDEKGVA